MTKQRSPTLWGWCVHFAKRTYEGNCDWTIWKLPILQWKAAAHLCVIWILLTHKSCDESCSCVMAMLQWISSWYFAIATHISSIIRRSWKTYVDVGMPGACGSFYAKSSERGVQTHQERFPCNRPVVTSSETRQIACQVASSVPDRQLCISNLPRCWLASHAHTVTCCWLCS